MALIGQVASQVLHLMQISGSMRCCLVRAFMGDRGGWGAKKVSASFLKKEAKNFC
jgi:hypothetical protein